MIPAIRHLRRLGLSEGAQHLRSASSHWSRSSAVAPSFRQVPFTRSVTHLITTIRDGDEESKNDELRRHSQLIPFNLLSSRPCSSSTQFKLRYDQVHIISPFALSTRSFSQATTATWKAQADKVKNDTETKADDTSVTEKIEKDDADSTDDSKPKGAYSDMLRKRATDFRDNARDSYQNFKDHPGQNARAGAKSIMDMVKHYGPVFIGTYASVYFITLGTLFLGVESGVLDPVNLFYMLGHSMDGDGEIKTTVEFVTEFMKSHTLTAPYARIVERNPEVANLAVAWVAVKFTEPIRLPVALAITPRISRYFGYAVKEENEGEKSSGA